MAQKIGELAIFGGEPAINRVSLDLLRWPLLDGVDEAAILDVVRDANFPNEDPIRRFEEDLAAWILSLIHISEPTRPY